MSVFQMVLGIVFLGVIAGMFKRYIDYKTDINKDQPGFDETRYTTEIDNLKKVNEAHEKRRGGGGGGGGGFGGGRGGRGGRGGGGGGRDRW